MSAAVSYHGKPVQNPSIVQWLLTNRWAGIIWLPIRLWVGYQWLSASLHKITSPAWMVTGTALQGFWTGAVKVADPAHPTIAFGWYRSFLQMMLDAHAYTWFAKLVATGELLIGIGLILGAFTGIAAFFGAFMNWNFMMAGSASTNPMMFFLAVLLVLAWRVAGTVGADYLLLSWLGTPWGRQPAKASRSAGTQAQPEPASTD